MALRHLYSTYNLLFEMKVNLPGLLSSSTPSSPPPPHTHQPLGLVSHTLRTLYHVTIEPEVVISDAGEGTSGRCRGSFYRAKTSFSGHC